MLRRILVGTDASGSADLAVRAAAEVAEAHHAELVVLHVRRESDSRAALDPRKDADLDGYMNRMRERFPSVSVRTVVEDGDVPGAICAVAEREDADLIVVGNRGTRDKRRGFLRSVPTSVMRKAPTSVLIVDTRIAQ